jgi:hypothetical protein
MMNAKTPIHALNLCTAGFSNISLAFPAILCRNEMRLNVRKKRNDSPSETAMKPGTAGSGSERRTVGVDSGRTAVSGMRRVIIISERWGMNGMNGTDCRWG